MKAHTHAFDADAGPVSLCDLNQLRMAQKSVRRVYNEERANVPLEMAVINVVAIVSARGDAFR